MDPLNQKIMIQNSNSLLMDQSPSNSQTTPVKRNLFTKDAKPLTLPTTTSKKTFGHQNLTTQNAQWIPTTKTALTATGIISTLSAGSYFTYQYFTKSAPLKVTVTPFSHIDPIRTILTALFPFGVIALGTKLYISRSNDRRNETQIRSNFEYDKKPTSENLLSTEEKIELLNKLLISISKGDSGSYQEIQPLLISVSDMLKNDQSPKVFNFAKKLIATNPDAASPIICLIAENHPKEIYPLIESVLLKNDKLHNSFLEKAMEDTMRSLDTYIKRLFPDENSKTNEISLQEILDIIQPYMLTQHRFTDEFYSKFITAYPLSGWNLAGICIGNETPLAKEIVEKAITNLFIHQDEASAKFAIKMIQQQLKMDDQDLSMDGSLQDLYKKLCNNANLNKIIENESEFNKTNLQEVANTMLVLALKIHNRRNLLPLLCEEFIHTLENKFSNLTSNQNEISTKTITNYEHKLT